MMAFDRNRFSLTRMASVVLLLSCGASISQGQGATAADERAREVLTAVGRALAGESKEAGLKSLVMTGKLSRFTGASTQEGQIRIDLLAPDLFLRTEFTNPRPLTFVSFYQGFDGKEAWVDRRISQTLGDDGMAEAGQGMSGRNNPMAVRSRGMRDVTTGTSVNRTEMPGNVTTERTVLGMPIPQPQGPEASQAPGVIREAGRPAAAGVPGRPGLDNPDVKMALTRRLLRDFACLSLIWRQQTPAAFPVSLNHAGTIKSGEGEVEALEITGPDNFAGRLFIDRATSHPLLLTYREMVAKSLGYVTNARPGEATDPESVEEAAIQIQFGDYRAVKGPGGVSIRLPFRLIRAINGRPVEEWRVEKYRLNSDLSDKRFQRPGSN